VQDVGQQQFLVLLLVLNRARSCPASAASALACVARIIGSSPVHCPGYSSTSASDGRERHAALRRGLPRTEALVIGIEQLVESRNVGSRAGWRENQGSKNQVVCARCQLGRARLGIDCND